MRISKDMQTQYKDYRRSLPSSHRDGKIDMEVDVLTNGYWPSQSVPPCTLPPTVQAAIDSFSKFYLEKHTGRKLTWQTSAGSAEIKAVFGTDPNKPHRHELCVSTYQLCILLLFNDNDTLSLGEIRSKTHIPDLELRRHLISLSTPKHRVLKKGSKGRGITSDDDTFSFNPAYTSKLKRVRIPLVKETSVMRADASSAGVLGVPGAADVNLNAGIDGSVPVAVEEDRRHLVEGGYC